ncbi:MAG: molybdate ABC transporter substrate-binding protein [Eubacteriales bacterium]
MKRKGVIQSIAVLAIISVFMFTGCSSKPTSETTAKEPETITISAAASLTDAINEIKAEYEKVNQGQEIVVNFASSGVLSQQIEQGAPTDLFISASTKYMDELEEKGLILSETRQDLLNNEVVLIAAKDSTFTGFDNLTGPEVSHIGIGAPESVPAGMYAKEVLENLAIWEEIQPKVVFAKDVRQVLAYVESGDTEVGMVYQTDAQISDKVKIIALAPANSHSSITYPMAVIKDSANQKVAEEFQKYLSSEKAKSIFEKYGFTNIEN